jgi:transcriptional regulator with XRE-family HTH domain
MTIRRDALALAPSATVASRIRARREHLGIHQSDLAKAIDRSQPTIAAMENGKTPITTDQLKAFAAVLRVAPSYLLGEDEEDADLDEVELLQLYRSLPDEMKRAAIGAIRGIAAETAH